MFNRGISELLEELPRFEGLDGATVKRLLTSAYLEGLDFATLVGEDRRPLLKEELRRLVTALEIHAVLVPGVEQESRRACAFVAAESLNLLGEIGDPEAHAAFFAAFGSRARYRRIEAGLLYLIAAFDANAAIAVRGVGDLPVSGMGEDDELEAAMSDWAMRQVVRLIRLGSTGAEPAPAGPPADGTNVALHMVSGLRIALWQRIGEISLEHLRWLRLETEDVDSGASAALAALGDIVEDESAGAYADIAHLARLLRFVCDGTAGRALRNVPPPSGDTGTFHNYLRRRCREKPLLWPSAERYRERCLPGPSSHAAVAMPTGAGKSGVAELAVAQALSRGWVVYLAPTRALVRQVRRDLRRALGSDVNVREFLGGAEFTALADDTLEQDPGRAVLVMTPEKCSLALRQSPEAFATLALCVFDECHLIGEPRNRGVLAELVLAQVMYFAPTAMILLQSALLGNPEAVADWLRRATGHPCEAIREPWRPTRTLRAIAGFDRPGLDLAQEAAAHELAARPARVYWPVVAPLNLLVNLQGAWSQNDAADYALANTTLTAPLIVSRTDDGLDVSADGYVNAATGSVAQGLVDAGHRVLAFIPANKHHSFSVARDVRGFGDQTDPEDETWQTLEHLLDLAEFELGTSTLLRGLLTKGVAVHTSAMLQDERRASELAYDKGIAKVVFATGTLAQGLNLPATAVVIGGISIGFDPDLTATQRRAREHAQLLNAVGRAGRPYVAARSLAIVLPNQAFLMGPEAQGQMVRDVVAPFLAEEDASFMIQSQLGPLVAQAVEGELTVEGMGVEGLTAFAFLPLRSNVDEAIGILGRSYAVAGRAEIAEVQVRTVAAAMVRLGEQVLAAGQAPDWLVEAAYESGLSLRQVVGMWVQLRELDHRAFPRDIVGWATVLVEVLSRMPYDIVAEMLPMDALQGSRMRGLADEFTERTHGQAWRVIQQLLAGWLVGTSLTDLAAVAVRADAAGKAGRGSGNPLPKIIGLTEQLLVFGMTRVAGGMSLLVATAAEREHELGWTLDAERARALEQLSMGVRAGCGDAASLAWWRFGGVRHRRLAHVVARILPLPADARVSDEAARDWVLAHRDELQDPDVILDERHGLNDEERKALVAAILHRDP